MPAGVDIRNNYGTILINEEFVQFGLSQKGSFSMTPDGGGTFRTGSVSVDGTCPVIAIAAPVETCLLHTDNSGSTFTFKFRSLQGLTGSDFNVDYWIFDKAENADGIGSSYGLQVFRADSSLAFDSGMSLMEIVDTAFMDPPGSWTGGNVGDSYNDTRTYTSGHSYAVVQGNLCLYDETWHSDTDYGPNSPGYSWRDQRGYNSVSQVSGATVYFGLGINFANFLEVLGDPDPQVGKSGNLNFWIIDVTNF